MVSRSHSASHMVSQSHSASLTVSWSHSASLTISLSHSASLMVSRSHSTSLTVSWSHSASLTVSQSHSASLTVSRSQCKSHSLTVSQSHSASLTVSWSHSASLTVSRSHSVSHTVSWSKKLISWVVHFAMWISKNAVPMVWRHFLTSKEKAVWCKNFANCKTGLNSGMFMRLNQIVKVKFSDIRLVWGNFWIRIVNPATDSMGPHPSDNPSLKVFGLDKLAGLKIPLLQKILQGELLTL